MTICAFQIRGDRAVAVTDAEIYRGGEPAGTAGKFAVNPLAPLLGFGAGDHSLMVDAAAIVTGSTSLEQALERLPGRLWHQAQILEGQRLAASAGQSTYALIGRSAELGRTVGYLMAGPDFTPRLTRSWSTPQVERIDLDGVAAGLALGRELLARLRQDLPQATGRRLVVAELERGRITTQAFDLADRPAALAELPAAGPDGLVEIVRIVDAGPDRDGIARPAGSVARLDPAAALAELQAGRADLTNRDRLAEGGNPLDTTGSAGQVESDRNNLDRRRDQGPRSAVALTGPGWQIAGPARADQHSQGVAQWT